MPSGWVESIIFKVKNVPGDKKKVEPLSDILRRPRTAGRAILASDPHLFHQGCLRHVCLSK